jgi:hypothetical protein
MSARPRTIPNTIKNLAPWARPLNRSLGRYTRARIHYRCIVWLELTQNYRGPNILFVIRTSMHSKVDLWPKFRLCWYPGAQWNAHAARNKWIVILWTILVGMGNNMWWPCWLFGSWSWVEWAIITVLGTNDATDGFNILLRLQYWIVQPKSWYFSPLPVYEFVTDFPRFLSVCSIKIFV